MVNNQRLVELRDCCRDTLLENVLPFWMRHIRDDECCGYLHHVDADGFVYSDAYSSQHIANLRKRIDKRFHTPAHVAGVVMKIGRILHWHVLAKASVTIPVFLTLLIATQANRKVHKRMAKPANGRA